MNNYSDPFFDPWSFEAKLDRIITRCSWILMVAFVLYVGGHIVAAYQRGFFNV